MLPEVPKQETKVAKEFALHSSMIHILAIYILSLQQYSLNESAVRKRPVIKMCSDVCLPVGVAVLWKDKSL